MKHKPLHELTFWMSITILVTCNFFLSIVLIPFLLVAPTEFIVLFTIALGILLGLIFNHVLADLEHIEPHHHLFAMVLLPLIAIMNIVIVVHLSTFLAHALSLSITHQPWYIGILYGAAILLPSILSTVRQHAKSVLAS
jgi:hypothetical protein